MPIRVFNENRLTCQPFFLKLINYLHVHEDVTLRQIHKVFEQEKNLDRQLDSFIAAGFIWRKDKRYGNNFKVFTDADFDLSSKTMPVAVNIYEEPFFVAAGSQVEQRLEQSIVQQKLQNKTNTITLHFSSRYDLTTDSLFNYFYKVAHHLPLTILEQEVYQLMGDVDPEYALKYMTSFLLKFTRKDIVKARPDIFIRALEKYGYISAVGEREFTSNLAFDDTLQLEEIHYDSPQDFISAQIQQTKVLKNFISIGG
ncbi:DUF1803 domain-containing protein [Lactococcus sp. LG606]|uniref:DUF1803 domain-containing protein n=1 Tax=Lactococcus sp. LG606 TaxID=2816912 RepID=UPI001A8D2065|nr:DUF1803 domain-containing protein [Lactococcus sp. LG606]QSR12763.1 DUF1803 domain-containing protein [Lactococcus sp. LG606]